MIPPQIVLLDFAKFNNAIRGRKILPAAFIFCHPPYYLRMVIALNPFVIKKGRTKYSYFFALAFKRVYLLFRHGVKPQKLARIFFGFAFRRCRSRELSPF